MVPDTRMGRPLDDDWPLVFIGKVRPHGRKGQQCKRLRYSDYSRDVVLVRFRKDGRDFWVLDRMLVRRDEY
jgi:hypothetical protein